MVCNKLFWGKMLKFHSGSVKYEKKIVNFMMAKSIMLMLL